MKREKKIKRQVERERRGSGMNDEWTNHPDGEGRCKQRGEDAPDIHCQSVIQPVKCDVWKGMCVIQDTGSFIRRHVEWKILRGN